MPNPNSNPVTERREKEKEDQEPTRNLKQIIEQRLEKTMIVTMRATIIRFLKFLVLSTFFSFSPFAYEYLKY